MKKIFKSIVDEAKVIFSRKTKDKIYASQREFDNVEQAKEAFKESTVRLFDVEKWSALPGITSTFELYDKGGVRKKGGTPEVGDYLRILLPGPFPENWVKVLSLQRKDNSAEFIVSPSEDPRDKDDSVEHFFADEATSTFKVERKGIVIGAYEIGKDEGVNNKGEEAGDREIVNTLIAEGGWAGFQKVQWKKLTEYLVHNIDAEDH